MSITSLNSKGFTLIELLVVVAIIGVLAAVGVVSFSGFIENAKDSKCTQQHKTVSNHVLTSIQRCSLNPNGTFPTGPDDNLPCSNLSSQENTQFLVLWTQTNKMMNAYNGYGCCGHANNRDPYAGETYIQRISDEKIIVKSRCGGSRTGSSGDIISNSFSMK